MPTTTVARFNQTCSQCILGEAAAVFSDALLAAEGEHELLERAEERLDQAASESVTPCVISQQKKGRPFLRGACPRGHEHRTFPNSPPHEILFETGLHAFHNQDHRTAVLDWFSAHERFLEFWCLAIMRIRNLDKATFDGTWKHLAKRSERQFGFFCATHLAFTSEQPPHLPSKVVEIRNQVAHGGRFPTESEAEACGVAIAANIVRLTAVLRSHSDGALKALTPGFFARLFGAETEWTQTGGWQFLPTFLGLHRIADKDPEPDLKDWITIMVAQSWMYDADSMAEIFSRNRKRVKIDFATP